MTTASNFSELLMARRDIVRFSGPSLRVTCVTGALWITQHLDTRDIVLTAGESFTLDRHGVAVVQATADSLMRVERCPNRALARPSSVSELFGIQASRALLLLRPIVPISPAD